MKLRIASAAASRGGSTGVGPNKLVALCLNKSPEMIVSLLAVLKAGGGYLPLDPGNPAERLQFVMEDSGTAHLITTSALAGKVPSAVPATVLVDADRGAIWLEPSTAPDSGAGPQDLAYCIYTSGSTGKPKGALIEHRNVVRLMVNDKLQFNFTDADVWTMFHSYSFDFSVWEMYGALLYGGGLVVVPEQVSKDPALFLDLVINEQVTVLNQTPTAFNNFASLDQGQSLALRYVIFGGEALRPALLREWRASHPQVKLINMYGITETTVHVTFKEIDDEHVATDTSNIGVPIPTTTTYIFDDELRLLPVGVPGEICVGGGGVCRGYLGRDELKRRKFVVNPYKPEEKIYRSGDLGKLLPSGEMVYMGRSDDQVQIRGFRVEPGEVQSQLLTHPSITRAEVIAKTMHHGAVELVAYVVASGEVDVTELRAHVDSALPHYMVPSAFVFIDQMPLTPNGKVDRRALPEPDQSRPELGAAFVAPRTQTEEILASMWAEVLGLTRVGVHDNFFDLGGHSLLATQVISRVRRVMDVEVELRRLFEAPTVAQLTESVEELRRGKAGLKAPPMGRAERRSEGLPLSFAQQRLWFIDQLAPGTPAYNIPLSLRVRGCLNFTALEHTLNEIVRRHEVLRTTFVARNRRPVQVIAEAAPFRLQLADLCALPDEQREREVRRLAREEARQSFDLGRGPLMRTRVLRLGLEEHVVLLTMHHIISDAWSMGVLVEEVAALYEAFAAGRPSPLAELPLQYADFAVWQREWMQGVVLDTYLNYWKRKLSGASPTFELKSAPHAADFRGADQSFAFTQDLSDAVKRLSRREGATLFMTLLAAFAVLLQRSAARDDIVIGTDVANRNRVEVESLIGFFVNMLVLRIDLTGNPTFRELLARVRETTLAAYEHQDLPFDKLVEAVNPERELGSTPLVQAKLVLQNTPPTRLELAGLVLTSLEVEPGGTEMSKFDLCLTVADTVQGLEGALAYSASLFDPEIVGGLLRHFETLLGSIVADPEARLDELEIFSPAEREQLAAEKRRRRETNIKRFKSTQPRAVGAGRRQLVKTDFLDPDKPLPLVFEPNLRDVDFFDWVSNNRDLIESSLLKHGAALFRGFGLNAQADLEQFLKALSLRLMKYVEGATPRTQSENNVFSSTEYPSDQRIALHHELTPVLSWPMKICFFCEQPASGGGETSIADVRNVLRRLSPRIVERFAEKGWMLVRNFREGSSLSWQKSFQSTNHAEAQDYFRQARIDWEWKNDGGDLTTRQMHDAVARHPSTGEMVWFNHVAFWHVSSLEPHVREDLLARMKESELPYNTYYGDGSPIEDSVVEEIRAAYREETAVLTWRTGDLLVLDNLLVAHGRNSYTGSRKILAAMGEAYTRNDNGHGSR